MKARSVLSVLGLIVLGLFSTVRSSPAFSAPPDPGVVINAVITTQYYVGQQLSIQSTSTDPAGIARVELLVDGTVVQTSQPPSPVPTFTVTQTWIATLGSHTLTVRSVNVSNQASESAGIPISVAPLPLAAATLPVPPTPAPSPTATPVTTGQCTDNAQFIADVTIPDGTLVAPGQQFIKTWRVRNTGTCTWTSSYLLSLASGEPMSNAIAYELVTTPPGATVDLPIVLVAPTTPGTHAGTWRFLTPQGIPFGTLLTVVIQVVGPGVVPTPFGFTPSFCSGTPFIESFSVSPSTINKGDTATLSWGFVGNANFVQIDQGIGGVSTPGSISVSPGSTTTYTLTAFCGANIATAQVTLTVNEATSTPTATFTPSLTPQPAPPTATPSRTPTRAPTTVNRCPFVSESGSVSKTGSVLSALQVGDDASNNSYRAFFSYDIADLPHRLIDSAELIIGPTGTRGNPFSLGALIIETVQYSDLSGFTYGTGGVAIATTSSGPSGRYDIRSPMQTFVNAARPRFQLRFRFASETNNNGVADMLTWERNTVCITITYR